MKTTVLYGEYDLTLDEKNRLLIPSEVRKSLDPERDGETFFILVGVNQRAWLFPERGYESMVAREAPVMAPGQDKLAFDQTSYSMANQVQWDKQFRILIPEKTIRRTGLGKDVTMIGVRDHLELWNRADWEAHTEQLLARRAENWSRAQQPSAGPST